MNQTYHPKVKVPVQSLLTDILFNLCFIYCLESSRIQIKHLHHFYLFWACGPQHSQRDVSTVYFDVDNQPRSLFVYKWYERYYIYRLYPAKCLAEAMMDKAFPL